MLLLGGDLRITAQTIGTGDWLSALLPRWDGPPVPAAAHNVAAQLIAQESGIDAHEAMGGVALAAGLWVTVRASRVAPSAQIAVTIEPTAPQDRLDVYSRASGLTHCESELLAQLADGADTREAAGRDGPIATHHPGLPEVNLRQDRFAQPPLAHGPRPLCPRRRLIRHRVAAASTLGHDADSIKERPCASG